MKAIEWLDDFMRRTPFGQFIKVLMYVAMICGCSLMLIAYLNSDVPQFIVGEFVVAPVIYMLGVRRDKPFWIWLILFARWYIGVLFGIVAFLYVGALFVGIPLPPPEDSKGIDSRLILLTSNWLNVSSETPFRLLIVVGISAMSALFLVPTSPSQRGNPHKRFWGSE